MIRNHIIRAAELDDAAQLAHIYIDTWRATYAHILSQTYLDQLQHHHTTQMMRQGLMDTRILYLIAEGPQHEALGYICGGTERSRNPIYTAEIYELYLLPAFQRRGIGRQLLTGLAHLLYERHLYSLMVWVLSANPYKRFYERANGIYLDSKLIFFGGRQLSMDAYGWIDIQLATLDLS